MCISERNPNVHSHCVYPYDSIATAPAKEDRLRSRSHARPRATTATTTTDERCVERRTTTPPLRIFKVRRVSRETRPPRGARRSRVECGSSSGDVDENYRSVGKQPRLDAGGADASTLRAGERRMRIVGGTWGRARGDETGRRRCGRDGWTLRAVKRASGRRNANGNSRLTMASDWCTMRRFAR